MPFVAGSIVSKLTLDRSKFSASIKAVQKQTKTLGGWVKKNSGQFKAMGLAIAAMGAAALLTFKKMVKQYVEVGDMIHKMAIRTGFAATRLSELAYAADISGADINMLEKGVKRMARTITEASAGLETYIRPLKRIGIEVKDLQKLTPEEQFLKISYAIAELEDPTLRAATAQEIFGRAGTMLLPLMAEGAEGMARLREEAHRLGYIFDEETAAKAAALKDAQTALTASVKGLSIAILNDLIPVVTDIVKNLTDWFVGTRKHAKTWAAGLIGFFKIIAQGIMGMTLAWHEFQRFVFEGAALIFSHLQRQVGIMARATLLMEKIPIVGKKIVPVSDTLVDIWKTLKYVTEGYTEAGEKALDKQTDLVVVFETLFAALDKISGGLKTGKDDFKSLGEVIATAILPPTRQLTDAIQKIEGVALPAARQLPGLFENVVTEMEDTIFDIEKSWKEGFWKIYRDATMFTSSLGSLFDQMSENQMARIERDYEADKAAIENSLMNEEEKAAAMEKLDKEFETKRKAAMKAQAKRTKAVGVMESIIHTAAAVAEALPNIPLAIAVGIMGAIQTALIAAQPLPTFAKGGKIDEAGIVGEEGPELFMPERPGTIIPLRERATAIGGTKVDLNFYAPIISTVGVSRRDIDRAAEYFLTKMRKEVGRYGRKLNA